MRTPRHSYPKVSQTEERRRQEEEAAKKRREAVIKEYADKISAGIEVKAEARARQLIEPDAQDFEKVEREYCANHKITSDEFRMKRARDMDFAADMYRLAQATKLIREVAERKSSR